MSVCCGFLCRWDSEKEIEDQFNNYEKLMDFMNSQPQLKIKVCTFKLSLCTRPTLTITLGPICNTV